LKYPRLAALFAAVVAGALLLPGTVSAADPAVDRLVAAADTGQVVLDEYGKPLPTPKLPPGIQGLGWAPWPVYFVNLHSNMCLEIPASQTHNGAAAAQWHCLAGNWTQQWWRYHIEGDGSVSWFYLYNANSGKCLEVWYPDNRARVMQWTCHWGNEQVWKAYGGVENGGYWNFQNEWSGRCLEVDGWRRDAGAPVTQWDCHGGANQRWGIRY
jgi:hypothetical protein